MKIAAQLFSVFFAVAVASPCVAQAVCDKYAEADEKVIGYKQQLKTRYTESLLNKFREQSLKAAELLTKCEQSRALTPLQQMMSYYQIGKFYLDAGHCEKASQYLYHCIGIPIAASTLFKDSGKTYKQKAEEMVQYHCFATPSKNFYGSPVRTISISYNGKYGVTQSEKNTYALINKNNVDVFPYTSDEIETLSERLYAIGDSTAAINSVRKMFADSVAFYFHSPYLIVDVNNGFTSAGYEPSLNQVDKNDGSYVPRGSNLLQEKKNVDALLSGLADRYKISSDASKFIHVIYLFNGPLSNEGFVEYLDFCNRIHFRYPGRRIGYFNSYDKSLVVWLATGKGTLAHEYIHLLIADDYPKAPAWMDEGMASLQEETRGSEPDDNWRLVYIKYFKEKYNGYIPLSQLLNGCRDCDEFNSIVYDCFARYFCFYLYEAGKLNPLYGDFRALQLTPSAAKQTEILERLFNRRLDQVQNDFFCWLNKRTVPQKWSFDRFVGFINKYVRKERIHLTVVPFDSSSGCEFQKIEVQILK